MDASFFVKLYLSFTAYVELPNGAITKYTHFII